MEVNGEEVFNGDGAAREASTRGKPSAEDLAAREEKKAAKKAANAQDRLKRSVSWRDDEQKGGDALVEVKEFRPRCAFGDRMRLRGP